MFPRYSPSARPSWPRWLQPHVQSLPRCTRRRQLRSGGARKGRCGALGRAFPFTRLQGPPRHDRHWQTCCSDFSAMDSVRFHHGCVQLTACRKYDGAGVTCRTFLPANGGSGFERIGSDAAKATGCGDALLAAVGWARRSSEPPSEHASARPSRLSRPTFLMACRWRSTRGKGRFVRPRARR